MSDIADEVNEFCLNNNVYVKMEDFDLAFIGYVKGFHGENIACYDYTICIRILMEYNMSYEEAEIYLENQILPMFEDVVPFFVVKFK